MIHPSTERRFISDEVGFGVVATADIPRGTLLWCRCLFDIVLTPDQVAALPPAYHHIVDIWSYGDPDGNSVLCWDNARFINHSCEPSMMGVGEDLEIAVRDIRAGEQITCDYALCNLTEEMPCSCGVPSCRHVIGPDDVLRLGESWERLRSDALALALSVEQPLRPYLLDEARFRSWAAEPTRVPRLRDYHHPRAAAASSTGDHTGSQR